MALTEEDNVVLARLEELLEENLKLAEDTNRILREVRRTGLISFWAKVILWTIVLILPLFLIGPLLSALKPYFNATVPDGSAALLGVPSPEQIQQAVELFKAQNGS
ncbi:MAG: hypothetical protein AB202_02525 [Parcubacteria bacterium C7867-007]|nr:MAG: hypothetical protein AB202_02525 [Parcubacteria bacterium C7867-007]